MIKFKNYQVKSHQKSRADATISLVIIVILASAIFLSGGIFPSMRDDTLKKDTSGIVAGVRSEDASGNSLLAAAGSSNDTKKTIQMKQLILVTPTPTKPGSTTQTNDWNITLSPITCQSGVGRATLTLLGPKKGYLIIEQEVYSGTFTPVDSAEFIPTEHKITLVMPNSSYFNSRKWKIQILEGGSQVGYEWVGGIKRKSLDQNPTSC